MLFTTLQELHYLQTFLRFICYNNGSLEENLQQFQANYEKTIKTIIKQNPNMSTKDVLSKSMFKSTAFAFDNISFFEQIYAYQGKL